MYQKSLCHEGKISIYGFISTAAPFLFCIYDLLGDYPLSDINFTTRFLWLAVFYCFVNIIFWIKLQNENYKIVWRAAMLGFIFCTSFYIFLYGSMQYKSFGIYGMFLAVFHYSEYLGIAISNPKTLSVDSFILNHSLHYHIAMIASWLEYGIESYYFPDLKQYQLVWYIGALICLGGEILRKCAMITASHNFTHVVQFEQVPNHKLVKCGVFSLMRHPSYVGWFYWSIGTQIILMNPICLILYTVASWKFFNDRIFMEEITLLNFFGDDYYQYQQNVPTGLPFIKGYKLEL